MDTAGQIAAEQRAEESLPYLATFVQVAELASFTAAAKELGVTQAAVSQRIHALERILAASVFDRHGGRVRLTPAGQRLYPLAQQIVALNRQAFEAVTGQVSVLGGELVIAASSVPGEHLLPGILTEFRRKHPQIRVRATVADSGKVIRQVSTGAAQLGLVGGRIDGAQLEYRPFATDEMVLVVPPEHVWRRRRRVSRDCLSREPLLVREPGSASRRCLEEALAAAGASLADFQVAMELGSNEAIKRAVRQGTGVSFISKLAVAAELASGELHALRIRDLPLRREFLVVRDPARPLSAAAQAFLQLCRVGRPNK